MSGVRIGAGAGAGGGEERPVVLCVASYEKGGDFIRALHDEGCETLLLTTEELQDAEHWPRDHIDFLHAMPDLTVFPHMVNGVSWMARSRRIRRIIPLDEFDLEVVAGLREHLCLDGMGVTETRAFRDKLTMRMRARDAGLPVPQFTSLFNDAEVRAWTAAVSPPWILKPRASAATMGIHRVESEDELWRLLNELGDDRSRHLLERFVPGDVFHADGIVSDGGVLFLEVHGYGKPPFEVTRGGGLFISRTLDREGRAWQELSELTGRLVYALGLKRGAIHAEYIRGEDGRFRFLEIAARVGGAHIADLVEATSGVNLWREWARVEVAALRGEPYELTPRSADYGGLIISLSRQEWPDTSAYDDPEVVWRLRKSHHAGLIVRSGSPDRIRALTDHYAGRFLRDYTAAMPHEGLGG